MNEALPTPPPPAAEVAPQALPVAPFAAPVPARSRWFAWVAALLIVLAAAALAVALNTQQRLRGLERELVKRQQESQGEAAEARMLSRQAQDTARESAAKVALLEARVSEAALQRSQLEDLIQSLSRSRDENIVADVENALRVAMQQSAITGSAEPLVATLKQSEERLVRYNQPRLERVRRAIARDLDRVKAVGVVDIGSLTLRLDEAVHQIDDLPLLSAAETRRASSAAAPPPSPRASASRKGAPASASAPLQADAGRNANWTRWLTDAWQGLSSQVWEETKGLVRVTRVETPEAALVAPEQAYFLRENVKLRLLNARLSLLSRQFDTAQSDLHDVQAQIERYFDRSSKRVQSTVELLRLVAAQARLVSVPRPDETLAALTAAGAGR